MRNLNVDALNTIATKLGTEPVTIIEIDWALDGSAMLYADRLVGTIPGKIHEVGDLDNVINVSDSDSSQELAVTLDDTDGTIKAIIDSNDIHKRTARVYQWFEGLDIDDRFMLFAGKISSPITWSERDRSVSFTIISQLEDKEIGFSAEEGDFQWIPKDLIGKAWPMIFGTVQDVPALQFNHAVTGTTLCPIGDVVGEEYHEKVPLGGSSPANGMALAMAAYQKSMLSCVGSAFSAAAGSASAEKAAEYTARAAEATEAMNDISQSIAQSQGQSSSQQGCGASQRSATIADAKGAGCNPVSILGGEDFPQGQTISLQIGSAVVRGHFSGAKFHYSSVTDSTREDRAKGRYEKSIEQQCSTPAPSQPFDFSTDVPCGFGNQFFGDNCRCRFHGWIIPSSPHESRPNMNSVAEHVWLDAGTKVSIASDENITYLVSIIPGTVMAVKAYKQFTGERRLVNVPNNLWWVETRNYGPISAVQVVTKKPLSSYEGQGWSDDIYVTFQSSIGPHTIDILTHLIDTYTDLEYDTTSFTAIQPKLDPFPMNFPILDRKNTLEVLQEIAFQARCALWLSNGKFYIKYLPEEPTSDSAITLSDLDSETGVDLELTSTEDLVTKMIVEWRLSWAEDDPNKLILRHNVKKYGTQQETFDFYCFNQPDIVLKVATFWLIRKSNTWKKVRFKTFLQHLNLETFDTVTLDFGTRDFISTGSIKAIVEEATYNSDDRSIDFLCLTPVKSGEMVEYKFFWPAYISASEEFPTAEEKAAGLAGGDGIGAEATGTLPIGFTDLTDWGSGVVWVGGPNVVFAGHADHGDTSPSDLGFVAQQITFPETYAELNVVSNPDPDLTLNYVDPMDPLELNAFSFGDTSIDIRTTSIYDSRHPDHRAATLDTIYGQVNADGRLVINTDGALYGNDERPDGELFDYRFDEDGGEWGAGTAFLKPDEA